MLQRKRKRRSREGEDFYRAGHKTIKKRNKKKLSEKKNWFKKKEMCEEEREEKRKEDRERTRDEDETQSRTHPPTKEEPRSVIFIPYTPNSRLAKEMRQVEEMMQTLTGTKFKIVEKIGTQMARAIVNKNPWKGRDCDRQDCFLCETKRTLGIGKQDTC